ncbi:MAG: tetratricopeptide repeat protein [Planctomycetes bacterium]|nr:tetratricopeptide repeat protein [Planctomycetota bacterium]
MKRIFLYILTILLGFFITANPLCAQLTSADKTLIQAQKFYQNQKYQEAVDVLEAFLKDNPEHKLAYRLLGHTFFQLDRFEDARVAITKALNLGSLTSDVLLRLAQLYQLDHNLPAALNALRVANIIEPEKPDLLLNLAQSAQNANLDAEAQSAYRAALSLDPSQSDVWLRLANLSLKNNHHHKAILSFLMAYYLGDSSENLITHIAELYVQLDDPESAIFWYSQIEPADTNQQEKIQLRRAQLSLASGNLDQANRLAETLTQSKDKTVRKDALLLLGQIAQKQNATQQASRHWQLAVELGSVDQNIMAWLGQYHYQEKEYKKAIQFLTQALAGDHPDTLLHLQLIASLIHTNNQTVAREQLIRYLEYHGLDQQAQRYIAQLASAIPTQAK